MKRVWCLMAAVILLLSFSANALIAVNGSFSALVDENGENVILPGVFSSIVKLTDDLYSVKSADTGRFALMAKSGEMLTESRYTLITPLYENALLFELNGKYGVMDENAAEIVAAEYTWLVSNGEGGYLALRTDMWDNSPDGVYLIDETGYVSPTGVKVASFLMDFSDGLSPALSTDNGKYGYLNPEGQWEIRPQYAYADEFSNGMAVAMLDSGSGVINQKGSWQITPRYDFVDAGADTVVCVDYDEGITVYSAETFEKVYSFKQDLLGAFVSVSGNSVIAYFEDRVIEFDAMGREKTSVSAQGYLFPAEKQFTIAYDEQNASLIDEGGNVVLTGYTELDELTVYDGCVYFTFVSAKGNIDDYLLGVIDETGKTVIDAQYASVTVPEAGYLLCENEDGMYLFRISGEMIWKYEY